MDHQDVIPASSGLARTVFVVLLAAVGEAISPWFSSFEWWLSRKTHRYVGIDMILDRHSICPYNCLKRDFYQMYQYYWGTTQLIQNHIKLYFLIFYDMLLVRRGQVNLCVPIQFTSLEWVGGVPHVYPRKFYPCAGDYQWRPYHSGGNSGLSPEEIWDIYPQVQILGSISNIFSFSLVSI